MTTRTVQRNPAEGCSAYCSALQCHDHLVLLTMLNAKYMHLLMPRFACSALVDIAPHISLPVTHKYLIKRAHKCMAQLAVLMATAHYLRSVNKPTESAPCRFLGEMGSLGCSTVSSHASKLFAVTKIKTCRQVSSSPHWSSRQRFLASLRFSFLHVLAEIFPPSITVKQGSVELLRHECSR